MSGTISDLLEANVLKVIGKKGHAPIYGKEEKFNEIFAEVLEALIELDDIDCCFDEDGDRTQYQ